MNMDEFVHQVQLIHMLLSHLMYLQKHELQTVQNTPQHFDRPLTTRQIQHSTQQKEGGIHTSAINVRFSKSWSRVHLVSKQNSLPTRAICPVRLQTTVGVPL